MFSTLSKKAWLAIAVGLLSVFCFVLFAHAFVPHDHAHDVYPTGVLSSAHSGVAGKEFELFVLATFLAVPCVPPRTFFLIGRGSLRFRVQSPEVLSLLSIRSAFANGLLNPRSH